MSGQRQSMPEGNKLVSYKCDEYQKKINSLLKGEFNYFSTQLPDDLSKMIDSIKQIANNNQIEIERKKSILTNNFKKMQKYIKKEINRNLTLYKQPGITPEQAESLDNISITLHLDVEAALDVPRATYSRPKEVNLRQTSPTDTAPKRQQSTTSIDENRKLQEGLLAKIAELEKALKESQAQFASLKETTTKKIGSLTSELQAANAKNIQLTASLENAEKQLLATRQEADKEKLAAATADASAAAAERRASAAQQQAIDSQQIVASKEARLQQVGDENQRLQAELEKSRQREREQLSGASTREKEFNAALAAKDVDLESLKVRALTAEGKVAAADEKASQAESRSLKLHEQIAKLQQELDLQKQTLLSREGGNADLQSQIGLLNEQLEQKTAKLQAQGELLASAKAENKTLLGENSTLREDNKLRVSENAALTQQLTEAQSLRLASKRELEDRLESQDRNFKILEAKLRETNSRADVAEEMATAAENQTAELRQQSRLQEGALTQLREENGTLQQRLLDLGSQLKEKDRVLLEKDQLLEDKRVQLQALPEDRDRAEKQQLSTIGLQREEIEQLKAKVAGLEEAQGVSATDKAEFDKLQALVKKQEEQIVKLTSENTEGIQARTVLSAENDELKKRNLELDPLKTKIGRLIADNAALRAKVASLEAENERLNKQSTESEKKQQDQLINLKSSDERADTAEKANTQLQHQVKDLIEKLRTAELEKGKLTAKNAELTAGQNGQAKRIVELEEISQKAQTGLAVSEKRLQEATKLNKSLELHSNPALGLEPGEIAPPQAKTGAADLGSKLSVLDAMLGDGVDVLATQKEFGSMLKHDYEEGEFAVKSSSYDPTNTQNKFQKDGDPTIAALLGEAIVFEGDPPQKMLYTKDLDQDSTILAGALTLEGISESQPKGGRSVQATMEDCDHNEQFVLDVLIKFHERIQLKLNGENPETACCTTIDYKGENQRLRKIINAHNKAARIINAKDKTDLATKKNQAASIQQAAEDIKKEIASPTIKPVIPRKSSM